MCTCGFGCAQCGGDFGADSRLLLRVIDVKGAASMRVLIALEMHQQRLTVGRVVEIVGIGGRKRRIAARLRQGVMVGAQALDRLAHVRLADVVGDAEGGGHSGLRRLSGGCLAGCCSGCCSGQGSGVEGGDDTGGFGAQWHIDAKTLTHGGLVLGGGASLPEFAAWNEWIASAIDGDLRQRGKGIGILPAR